MKIDMVKANGLQDDYNSHLRIYKERLEQRDRMEKQFIIYNGVTENGKVPDCLVDIQDIDLYVSLSDSFDMLYPDIEIQVHNAMIQYNQIKRDVISFVSDFMRDNGLVKESETIRNSKSVSVQDKAIAYFMQLVC